jgi:hypothetical protein
MTQADKLVVDDELYVNETTLEALSNKIESDVRRSLRGTVLAPLLAAGVVLIVFAVFWLIPREVGTLLREDPLVNQRFREATAQYLGEPAGRDAIREQIDAVLQSEAGVRTAVNEAASAAVSQIDIDGLVAQQVGEVVEEESLGALVADFLESEEGQRLLSSATREYFASGAGQERLSEITASELQSPRFLDILVEELDRALSE